MTDTRTRILDGAGEALVRFGLAKTTVEDIASAAGVGRATVYRWFDGGRNEVFDALVARELGKVADEIITRISSGPDLAAGLHDVLRWGGPAIRGHTLLQAALDTGPEELAVRLARIEPGFDELVAPIIGERLAASGASASPDEDAAYLVAMVMSVVANPGSWDLDDDAEVSELVDTLMRSALGAPGSDR